MLECLMAEPVVGRPFLRIFQDLVGFVDFLELDLGRMVAAIAIGISFIATIYPSRQASKLDPAQALRYQ